MPQLARVIGNRVSVEAFGAFLVSTALHCLLLLVLSAPSTYLPVAGNPARFQVLWFSAETLPSPAPSATQVLPAAALGPQPQDEEAAPDDENSMAFGAATPAGSGARPATRTAERAATRGDGAHAGENPPAAAASGTVEPQQVRTKDSGKGRGPGNQANLEKTVPAPPAANPALKRPLQEPVAPSFSQAAAKLPRDAAADTVSQGTGSASTKAEPVAPRRAERAVRSLAEPDRPRSREAEHPFEAAPRMPPPPEQQEPKGMVFPVVRGDLALVVVGTAEIELSVFFRAYPRSRRTTEVTRAGGRRQYKLTPIVVKTADKERRAVIEKVSDGVYTLVAEAEAAHPPEANFIVELCGGTGSKTVKPLGSITVAGRRVIAKVLMPEGLLWDDASAFTGSMVDAESTTKFNSSTGLIWKEYDP